MYNLLILITYMNEIKKKHSAKNMNEVLNSFSLMCYIYIKIFLCNVKTDSRKEL